MWVKWGATIHRHSVMQLGGHSHCGTTTLRLRVALVVNFATPRIRLHALLLGPPLVGVVAR